MKKIVFLLVLTGIIFSCSVSKPKSDINKLFTSFISSNDDILTFGKMDLLTITEKLNIAAFPMFGEIVTKQVDRVENAIFLSEGVYFAISGSPDVDLIENQFFGFAGVVNKDSLRSLFSEAGYFFEEKNGFSFAYEMGSAVAFNDDILVLTSIGFDEDALEVMEQVMKKCYAKKTNEKLAKFIEKDNDIAFVGRVAATIDENDLDLPQDKLDLIKELSQDGYVYSSLNFLNGEIRLETFYDVNPELEKLISIGKPAEKATLALINTVSPIIAGHLSFDIAKLENLFSTFYPNMMKDFYQSLGTTGLLLKGIGGDGLSTIIDGNIAFSISDFPNDFIDDELPEFIVALGLGSAGKTVVDILVDLSEIGEIDKSSNNTYSWNGITAKILDNHLVISKKDHKDFDISREKSSAMRKVNYGSQSFQIVADFQALLNSGLDIRSRELKRFISLFDYAYLEQKGMTFTFSIFTLNKELNILDNLLKTFQEELQDLSNIEAFI